MNGSSNRNLAVGLFVLAGLLALFYLSMRIGDASITRTPHMTLYASFDEIGGLKPHSKVTISGVKVGQVAAISLDKDYRARVEMQIASNLELPVDTSASVLTAGVLGDQYLSLQLGAEDETLKDGEELSFTESALILERMIGKLIHNTDIQGDS